jgi:hypothetical protein
MAAALRMEAADSLLGSGTAAKQVQGPASALDGNGGNAREKFVVEESTSFLEQEKVTFWRRYDWSLNYQ